MARRFLAVATAAVGLLAAGCAGAVEGSGASARPTNSAAESTRALADPAHYAVPGGKHVFTLESGEAGCWLNLYSDPTPHMLCDLPLPQSDPPIADRDTAVVEPANAVAIDSAGARKVVNVAGANLIGAVLPAGSTLIVGPQECTATSATSMACQGPEGSFDFDGDARAVVLTGSSATTSAEPTRPRAAGPTEVCGHVANAIGGQSPVAVLTGQVDCDFALALANRYLHDPGVVKEGQGQYAQIEGWMCLSPYVEGRSHAESYLRCDDDPVRPLNSLRIGD